MGTTPSSTKIIPIVLEESLYQLIETQAQIAGETPEAFILNRLHDSIEAWTDYCFKPPRRFPFCFFNDSRILSPV